MAILQVLGAVIELGWTLFIKTSEAALGLMGFYD